MEISLLEARSGINPKLNRCKPIAMALRSQTPTIENLKQLSLLREEGIKRKLFTLRKEVQRIGKKGRAFAIQRIIKKIKATTNNPSSIDKLENDLKLIKAINLEQLSEYLLGDLIDSNEYLKEKISFNSYSKGIIIENISLISGNALEKNLKVLTDDLIKYIRILYHEEITSPEASVSDDVVKNIKEKQTKSKKRPPIYKEDIVTSGGNRKGQRARRLEWEKKYGESAKHLKDPSIDSSSIRRYKNIIPKNPHPSTTNNARESKNSEVHPSWEAQRKKKEMERIRIDSAPTNQRITFD